MFWIVVLFCNFSFATAYLWGGQQLSIADTDVIHVSEKSVATSEEQVVK